MDINSYVLGMLTVVMVIIVAVAVLGLVKALHAIKIIKSNENYLNIQFQRVEDTLSKEIEGLYREINDLDKRLTSSLDSRIDKLASKINKPE